MSDQPEYTAVTEMRTWVRNNVPSSISGDKAVPALLEAILLQLVELNQRLRATEGK